MTNRRRLLALPVVALLTLAAACGGADTGDTTGGPTPTAGPQPPQTLIDAAKTEGTVTWYTAVPPNVAEPVVADFTKRYGIKVTVNRQVSAALSTLLTTEVGSGKIEGDVLEMGDSTFMRRAADKGWLLKPDPAEIPSVSAWPSKWVYSAAGSTYTQAVAVYTILYNKAVVGDNPPKQWADLNDPKWKGKVMLGDPHNPQNLAWLYRLYKVYGATFLQQLGQQNFKTIASIVPGANSVASGDVTLLAPSAHWVNTGLIDQGAPIEDAYPAPAMGGAEDWAGAIKGSPHPNAAKLFLNYLLSPEGQTATCRNLCSSVLNVPGTVPFPADYASPDLTGAVEHQSELLGLLGVK